jgi:serine/threonine-protein kinase
MTAGDETLPTLGRGDTLPAAAAAADEGPEELAAGSIAGEYVIESALGRGGAATVYLATRPDGQRAAIKVLSRNQAVSAHGVERFLREVATVHRIRHPNIVEIYDLGRLADDRPYYAMELLEGTNLRRLVTERERMTVAESLPIVEGVCAGLAAAHAAGVVHRDLKAENVMVVGGKVKLVDFGIAKLLASEQVSHGLTSTGQFLGTPVAMAPEQIRGVGVDQRTDIYAIGVLVYLLLTGTLPFRGNWEDVVRMHLSVPPRPPSEIVPLSPMIDAVVLRCLEKDPAARFPTVDTFLEAYRTAVDPGAMARERRAGIGVLVRTEAGSDDEDAIVEAAMALESAGAALREAGYSLALETSCEVLGARILPIAAEDELAARRQAIADARRIHDALAGTLPAGVTASVRVHRDGVDVRQGSTEIVGGKLLELGGWGPTQPGVTVTESARVNEG